MVQDGDCGSKVSTPAPSPPGGDSGVSEEAPPDDGGRWVRGLRQTAAVVRGLTQLVLAFVKLLDVFRHLL